MDSFAEHLIDADARSSRRELVGDLAMALAEVGSEAKRVAPGLGGDRAMQALGVGLVSALTCELVQGILILCETRVAYSAMALARQIVETEYLAWALSEDIEEARDWMSSDKSERLKRWQPSRIRARADGRFRGTDYGFHCEIGGHPTPDGARSILDNRELWVEVALYEAAKHGTSAFHYLIDAVQQLGPIGQTESHARLDAAYEGWKQRDGLFEWGLENQGPFPSP